MASVTGLDHLLERKRRLLVVSDLNRQVLRLESHQLSVRIEPIERVVGWVFSGWKWIVPILGFLAARKFKKTGAFFSKSSFVLMVLRKIWSVWHEARKSKERDKGFATD